MHRKLYPHTVDTKNSDWHPLFKISNNLLVLAKNEFQATTYSLFYKHTFNFFSPRKLLESELFNIKYQNPKDIKTIAEKLRYYRYKNALLQKEVAEYANICESTYIDYESTDRIYYPLNVLKKIAELYSVDISEFMDEYNLFVNQAQGESLKSLRKELNLTKQDFAKRLNIKTKIVSAWENETRIMSKNMYIRIFKDRNF